MAAATKHPSARHTRERILTAAERRAAAVGLNRLRVGQVATEAGVSRQTVYNEFGDKFGLAQAIAVRVANRLLDVVEAEMVRAPTVVDAVIAAISQVLSVAYEQPLIKIALQHDDNDDMLALLTTDAGPILDTAHRRLSAVIARLWPQEHPDDVDLAVELAVRLAISHIVCPTEPADEAARRVARVIEALRVARRHGSSTAP